MRFPKRINATRLTLLLLPLVLLLSFGCTNKPEEVKELENLMLEKYPDRFLRAYFDESGELSLEFELVEDGSAYEELRKQARSYAIYALEQFPEAQKVTQVTIDMQAASTGSTTSVAASETFQFEAGDLK